MLIGRFAHDRPDAGDRRLAGGEEDGAGLGRHLPDRTAPLFVGLLVGVILIVGGLTFFPALALGPIVEHFAMHAGTPVLSGDLDAMIARTACASARRVAVRSARSSLPAIGDAFAQARPARAWSRNPVMFVRRGRWRR